MVIASLCILLMPFTPISLPGRLADHLMVGIAFIMFWHMLASARPLIRYGLVGLYYLQAVAIYVLAWPLMVGIFVLGDLTRDPIYAQSFNCHRLVQMVAYGWVANSGLEVTVFERPFGLSLEIELGSKKFSDFEYESDKFSAIQDSTQPCDVVIAYEGKEIWRVQ